MAPDPAELIREVVEDILNEPESVPSSEDRLTQLFTRLGEADFSLRTQEVKRQVQAPNRSVEACSRAERRLLDSLTEIIRTELKELDATKNLAHTGLKAPSEVFDQAAKAYKSFLNGR